MSFVSQNSVSYVKLNANYQKHKEEKSKCGLRKVFLVAQMHFIENTHFIQLMNCQPRKMEMKCMSQKRLP